MMPALSRNGERDDTAGSEKRAMVHPASLAWTESGWRHCMKLTRRSPDRSPDSVATPGRARADPAPDVVAKVREAAQTLGIKRFQ
jgi:hypothetical protein